MYKNQMWHMVCSAQSSLQAVWLCQGRWINRIIKCRFCLHQVRMFTKVAMIYGSSWFAGTTIMPHIFRCFGAKIGKRVTLRTLDLSECDLIEIGDDCMIEVRTCCWYA
jgi:hypothetical protein